MEYVIGWLVGLVIGWVSLLVVMLIAQRFADFGMPPFVDFAWKAAVVVGVTMGVDMGLDQVHPWLGWGASLIIWAILMMSLFDLDMFQLVVIVVVSWILQLLLMMLAMMLLGGLLMAAA